MQKNLSTLQDLLGALFLIVLLVITVSGCSNNSVSELPDDAEVPATGVAGDGNLDGIMEFIRAEHGLPALAAITVHDGEIVEKSAMGERAKNTGVSVSVDDLWHIGSVTKSMTSILAAMLVENHSAVRWDITIAEVFPDLIGSMRPEYEDVRLDELLSHTSGLPHSSTAVPGYDDYFFDTRDIRLQREEYTANALLMESSTERGEYIYNNVGYVVAGAMLERLTGESWENLLRNHLFDAANMTNSGFGAPDTLGQLTQPVGHTISASGWEAVDPTVEAVADSPAVIGPAGTVHSTLDDMAAYMSVHLKALRNEQVAGFPTNETMRKLYTSMSDNNYGLGWNLGNQLIHHNGSNTIWYCWVTINAERNTALFVVTNAADLELGSDSHASQGITEALTQLGMRADAAFYNE